MNRPTIEVLRDIYLSDKDIKYVETQYPECRPKGWCPTCGGKDSECDHELQVQAFKHYANAGIGLTYMRISWDMYFGDPQVRAFCMKYEDNLKAFKENNIGMLFLGDNGIGKTTAMSLILKDLVLRKQKCFFTTYSKLVTMLGDSFYSPEARKIYNDRIINSTFLGIDDVGKEMTNRLTTNTIDNVLRERIQASRPTFMTSNLSRGGLLDEYGKSSFSLLMEAAKIFEIDDSRDARSSVRNSKLALAGDGVVKPIV